MTKSNTLHGEMKSVHGLEPCLVKCIKKKKGHAGVDTMGQTLHKMILFLVVCPDAAR